MGHSLAASTSNSITPISAEANLLRSKIEALGLVSSTDTGARWLLKALHPAEPSVSNVKLPDGCSQDTVAVETCMTYSLKPTSSTNWGAQMTLLPHPTCMMDIYPTEGASLVLPSTIRNPLFQAAAPDDDLGSLIAIAEEWRMTSMSVTMHLDANATTDSGTVVAAMIPVKPNVEFFSGLNTTGTVYCSAPTLWFNPSDYPTYTQLLQMPKAYQANLRTGIYMPMRLSNTSQHWKGFQHRVKLINPSVLTLTNSYGVGYVNATTATPAYPNWDLSAMRNASGVPNGAAMASFLGDNFGRICISNVAPTSAVVIKIKLGLELKVQPTSSHAVHLSAAPPIDQAALASYFAIIRQLPDAYPADYNDGGKILSYISKAIKAVAPFLKVMPGVGGLIGTASDAVVPLLDYGVAKLSGRKQKKQKQQRKKSTNALIASVLAPTASAEDAYALGQQLAKTRKVSRQPKVVAVKRKRN